jgi:hypothetical protein
MALLRMDWQCDMSDECRSLRKNFDEAARTAVKRIGEVLRR